MLRKTLAITAVGCAVFCSHAAAPAVKALPVDDKEIRLDGVLNESIWQKAERYTNFTRWKHPETPAAEQTEFQVAASRKGLYFAFNVIDKDIVATITETDGPIAREDVIELFITGDDPIPDDPNVHICRQLLFNPLGVRTDITHLSGVSSRKWNSDWRVAVKRNSRGYTAEVFVPYYALNIVNGNTKNFNFNIARENNTGEDRELSVFNPTPRFISQNHFVKLELPFNDFNDYQWQQSNLELKTVPAGDGTVQILQGTVTGKVDGNLVLQAVVRQDDKIVAFNRITVFCKDSTAVAFTMPLEVGKSGTYSVTLTGRTEQGKVFHQVSDLTLEAVPFKLLVNNPVYRHSIYPDQQDKVVSISVDYQSSSKLLNDVKTAFTVSDGSGKVINEQVKNSGSVRTFTVDGSKWLPGKYTVTVKSTGVEALKGTLQQTLSVVAPHKAGNTVRLGKNRELFVNGKRFFPRGFLAVDDRSDFFYKEMAEAGYNVIHFYALNQRHLKDVKATLDAAYKHNLKVIFYPYARCSINNSGFRDNVLRNKRCFQITPQTWARMKEMVNMFKEHPAFLGWYLADEPKGAELCAELKKVFQLLKDIDPHHPVIHLDFTVEGCISKREGYADLHILDMYPHPMVDGGWQRSISSVLYGMKQVSESVKPYGAWFCPQAFKVNSPKNRSMTYREIRCIVFGSIVNGAMGILPYKIGDPNEKYYQPVRNSGIFISPEMHLGYLKGIGPELRGLEDMLLSPEQFPVKSSVKYIAAMGKKLNGKNYIAAVNSMADTFKCTLTGMPDGVYQVLGENRTVTVKNGKLNDEFIGFMTHIYTNDLDVKAPVNIPALEDEIKKVDAAARAALKK